MKLWATKEQHKVGKKRETHLVKIVIPRPSLEYVFNGIKRLQENHQVPLEAHITIINRWETWVQAYWIKEIKQGD